MTFRITEETDGVSFLVRVIPRSSSNCISGVHGEAVKIRLTAPPVEGAANKALIKFLAERLGVKPDQVEILSGHKSRIKRLRVTNISVKEISTRLLSNCK